MKLYDFTLAPSPRRVRIFLAEKGIDVELVQVDIMRNANRTPEFYKKNPLGSLPILDIVHDRFRANRGYSDSAGSNGPGAMV